MPEDSRKPLGDMLRDILPDETDESRAELERDMRAAAAEHEQTAADIDEDMCYHGGIQLGIATVALVRMYDPAKPNAAEDIRNYVMTALYAILRAGEVHTRGALVGLLEMGTRAEWGQWAGQSSYCEGCGETHEATSVLQYMTQRGDDEPEQVDPGDPEVPEAIQWQGRAMMAYLNGDTDTWRALVANLCESARDESWPMEAMFMTHAMAISRMVKSAVPEGTDLRALLESLVERMAANDYSRDEGDEERESQNPDANGEPL